jgi:hypothetical protein
MKVTIAKSLPQAASIKDRDLSDAVAKGYSTDAVARMASDGFSIWPIIEGLNNGSAGG